MNGSFTWETAGKPDDNGKKFGADKEDGSNGEKVKEKPKKDAKKKHSKNEKDSQLPISRSESADKEPEEPEKPFELVDLHFIVPKGSFVAIVFVKRSNF